MKLDGDVNILRLTPSLILIALGIGLPSVALGQADPTRLISMDRLEWDTVAPGVWRAQVGEKEWGALDFASPPNRQALVELGTAGFPFEKAACLGQRGPSHTHVRLPLKENERLYGMGLEFKGANRRGQVYHLKVDHYGGVKGYTHAPVPLYFSSAGYGVLLNTARRPALHLGVSNRKDSQLPPRFDRTTQSEHWRARPVSDAVEGSVDGPGLEVYVFGGQTPLEAVQRYNLYCGGGVLPPRWGLGFWHRMHTQSSDQDVLQEVADFKKYDFPLDVIGLEPGWQSAAYPCTFDWDKSRFPDPGGFLYKLLKQGIRVNLWENPYVHPKSTLYEAIKPYTGSHTVWLGEAPDYTLPEARKILLDHHKRNHLDLGVSGYKIDEVDGFDAWLWPDHAIFPSGYDGAQMRQLYGLILQKLYMDQFRAMNQRTYGLVRGSNAGASSHGFVIYSDYYEHRGYVTALTNCSMAGVLWTPEIRSARTPEEWLRRFQSVAFSPMLLLNAWYSGNKPWSFPEVTNEVRQVVQLRVRLLPYLYTAFADYQQKGIPPFRAMVLESGDQTSGMAIARAEMQRQERTDQYMMGPSILVAPVFSGETSREVALPRGNWYDFYTGKSVGNGETISIRTELGKIPLFVKDGGIIPLMPSVNNLAALGKNIPLEVRHYGSKQGAYVLYDDDGETFDYEGGEFSKTELRVVAHNGNLKGSQGATHGNWNSRYGEITWKFMGIKEGDKRKTLTSD